MNIKNCCWQNENEEYFEFNDGTDMSIIKDHFKRWLDRQDDGQFYCYLKDGVLETSGLVGNCTVIAPKKVDIG